MLRLAAFPVATPALDFTLVCLLKKLMGFKRNSAWELLNPVFFECFLVCAAICMGFEEKINASSQVDVTIVGSKGIFVILLQ